MDKIIMDSQLLETKLQRAEQKVSILNKMIEDKTRELFLAEEDLKNINKELRQANETQKEYLRGLETMLFMTNHKVRQPIVNILGIANLLDNPINSPDELKKLVGYIKQSALSLDTTTNELTAFIHNLEQKES